MTASQGLPLGEQLIYRCLDDKMLTIFSLLMVLLSKISSGPLLVSLSSRTFRPVERFAWFQACFDLFFPCFRLGFYGIIVLTFSAPKMGTRQGRSCDRQSARKEAAKCCSLHDLIRPLHLFTSHRVGLHVCMVHATERCCSEESLLMHVCQTVQKASFFPQHREINLMFSSPCTVSLVH